MIKRKRKGGDGGGSVAGLPAPPERRAPFTLGAGRNGHMLIKRVAG